MSAPTPSHVPPAGPAAAASPVPPPGPAAAASPVPAAARRRRLSLRQNFLWVLMGSLIENAAKWAMLVVLTKLGTPELVGAFSYALAVVTPVTILAQLQLRVALITDSASEHPFGAYWALRLVCTGLSMIGIAAMAATDTGTGARLILLVGAGQAVVSLRDIWSGLAQKHERMDATAWGNILDGLLSLGFFAAAMVLTGSLLWATGVLIVARVLVLVLYDIPAARRASGETASLLPTWDMASMRRLFWVALPLGLTTALVSLNSNIPRYLIEHWLGKEELGYFAALAYLIFASQLIIGALGRAASPRLAVLYRQNRRHYGVVLGKLVAIGVALALCGVMGAWLLGEPILRFAYSDAYAQQAPILVLLMVAGGIMFVNTFLGTAISAARFFKVQTVSYVIVGAITLAAGMVLIPRYGLTGAAWSAVVTSAVTTAINAGVVIHVYRRPTA